MVGIEVIGNHCCGSVTAVCGAESIIHIYVGVRSQFLCKFFLAFFHFFLGSLVCGIFFVDAHGLAFFFGIEAKVFEQECLTGLEGCCHVGCRHAVVGKSHVGSESLGYGVLNLAEGEFGVNLAFGLAHMAHYDKRAAVGEYFFEGGKSSADTGIVGDVAVFIQRHIEVYAYDSFFALEVKIVDCHLL